MTGTGVVHLYGASILPTFVSPTVGVQAKIFSAFMFSVKHLRKNIMEGREKTTYGQIQGNYK
jgi:hypothetical protein